MTEFHNGNFTKDRFERFYIIRTKKAMWSLPKHFYNKKWKYVLYGDFIYSSYAEGKKTVADIIGAADTKAELLLQCALRGIEVDAEE